MRKLAATLSAIGLLAISSSAHAVTFDPTVNPWHFHDVYPGAPTGGWYFYPQRNEASTYLDFTLPPGSAGRMDLWIDSDDPNATVYLAPPNEVYGVGVYDYFGTFQPNQFGSPASYSWLETVLPHHTVVTYSVSAGFDDCGSLADPANFNGFCSSSPNYWGNMDTIGVTSTASAHVYRGPPPSVPEPMSWALMLAGFFSLGGALRRRRATRPSGRRPSSSQMVRTR